MQRAGVLRSTMAVLVAAGLSPAAAAQTPGRTPPAQLTTLYNFGFPGQSDNGSYPNNVIIGEGGVLYGTAASGGTYNGGTVFSLTPPAMQGGSWAETVLHNFAVAQSDGNSPIGKLAIGPGRVIYGATLSGGTAGGTIYSLTPPASPGGPWTEAVLYKFQGGTDSVTVRGGGDQRWTRRTNRALRYHLGRRNRSLQFFPPGCGTVFSLTAPASPGSPWIENVLYSFQRGSDGAGPTTLVMGPGASGQFVLYGITPVGGSRCDCGVVFFLTPPAVAGGAWTEAVLYDLGNSTASGKFITVGPNGVLYGITDIGAYGSGEVFELTPPSSPGGSWLETSLYDFVAGPDGASPSALVAGQSGVLYGTASSSYGPENDGTVFSLTPPASPGGTWAEDTLHGFSYADGTSPNSIVQGTDGTLYGTTSTGGSKGGGTVFQVSVGVGPFIQAYPATLSFNVQSGGSAPPPQSVAVSTSDGSSITFSASPPFVSGYDWLSVMPPGGSTPLGLTVSVDPMGLAAGTYNGTIRISSPGFGSQTISVSVVIPTLAPSLAVSGPAFFALANTDPRPTVRCTYRPLIIRSRGSRWRPLFRRSDGLL